MKKKEKGNAAGMCVRERDGVPKPAQTAQNPPWPFGSAFKTKCKGLTDRTAFNRTRIWRMGSPTLLKTSLKVLHKDPTPSNTKLKDFKDIPAQFPPKMAQIQTRIKVNHGSITLIVSVLAFTLLQSLSFPQPHLSRQGPYDPQIAGTRSCGHIR